MFYTVHKPPTPPTTTPAWVTVWVWVWGLQRGARGHTCVALRLQTCLCPPAARQVARRTLRSECLHASGLSSARRRPVVIVEEATYFLLGAIFRYVLPTWGIHSNDCNPMMTRPKAFRDAPAPDAQSHPSPVRLHSPLAGKTSPSPLDPAAGIGVACELVVLLCCRAQRAGLGARERTRGCRRPGRGRAAVHASGPLTQGACLHALHYTVQHATRHMPPAPPAHYY